MIKRSRNAKCSIIVGLLNHTIANHFKQNIWNLKKSLDCKTTNFHHHHCLDDNDCTYLELGQVFLLWIYHLGCSVTGTRLALDFALVFIIYPHFFMIYWKTDKIIIGGSLWWFHAKIETKYTWQELCRLPSNQGFDSKELVLKGKKILSNYYSIKIQKGKYKYELG